MTTAVVVGAGMAGLLSARALSPVVDTVIVVDRDEFSDHADPRRCVPQGRHAHALLAAGRDVLEDWFPRIGTQLRAAGAFEGPGGRGLWWQDGGFKVIGDFGVPALAMSRPLLEGTVRDRVVARSNVEIRSGVKVDGLILRGDEVVGVRVGDHDITADLVVDCAGRGSRLPDDLVAAGFPEVPTSTIRVGVTYGTTTLRREPDDLPMGATFAVVAPTPPGEPRGGVLLPIEGDRWMLTLSGIHGDDVPTDPSGYLAHARSLPIPDLADLLVERGHLSPVVGYRYPTSVRRHVEKVRRHPVGHLGLGDVICSFNPIYGQGMTSAALQAVTLGRTVARLGVRHPRLARTHYRTAAKVVDGPWQIAAGADFLDPRTEGHKAPGTDLVNRYVHHVQQATHVSRPVLERMIEVQAMLRPPSSLLRPVFMAHVLAASRRAGRRPAAARQRPTLMA